MTLKLSRTERLIAFAIFAVKALLSAAALFQVQAGPFGRVPILDEATYFEWAGTIAGGDVLGHELFAQDALYPYLLAAMVKLGGGLLFARLFNCVLAFAALAIFFSWARAVFNNRAALIGAALLVLWGSLLLDEVSVGKESLLLFLCALTLWTAERAVTTEKLHVWLGTGVCVGALALIRGNFLLIAPALGVLIALRRPKPAALFAAGVALALLPLSLRNYAAAGDPNPSAISTGMNLYIGNHPGANGTYQRLAWVQRGTAYETDDYRREASRRLGHETTAREANRYWTEEALTWLSTEVPDAVVLMVRKLHLAVSARELPNNASLRCMRELFAPALSFSFLGFGWLLPLALAGCVAWGFDRRPARYVIFAAALYGGTLAITFILERYRVPLAPVIAGAAGYAVDRAIELGRSKTWPRLAGLAGAALLTAIPVWWPLEGFLTGSEEIGQCANLVGSALTDMGDFELALPLLKDAVGRIPRDAEAHYNFGVALQKAGENNAAELEYAQALQLKPDHPKAAFNEALLRLAAGAPAATLRLLPIAAPLGAARVSGPAGAAHAALGDFEQARPLLETAVRLDPRDGTSWNLLINVEVKLGQCADAKRVAAEARAAGFVPAEPDCL